MHRKKRFGGITVAGVPLKEEKHRGAQLVMALALGALFCLPFILWGLGVKLTVVEVGALAATVVLLILAIAVWAIRSWDY